MILPQKIIFSKHQNKAEFKNLDDSEVLSIDFSGVRTSAASLISLASTASKTLFHQKTSWFWWLNHPWHQNNQYWALFVECIVKNPIFHCYLISFLSEAVEASRCYFFENWLMKLKCPHLLKPLGTIIQQNYWFFYPSELIYFALFTMRHPVLYVANYILVVDTFCTKPSYKFPFLTFPACF